MKGTLVKEYEDFYLISDKEIQKGDEYVKLNNRPRTLLLGTTISHVTKVSKLSLKNCEAIAKGYDLDELAEKYAHYMNDEDGTSDIDFKVGFQKALEILGDKKFSEEDMFSFAEYCLDNSDCFSVPSEGLFKKWKSLQQTEWDVEVVMNRIPADLAPGGWDVFPKLDAQGCLILKRVE